MKKICSLLFCFICVLIMISCKNTSKNTIQLNIKTNNYDPLKKYELSLNPEDENKYTSKLISKVPNDLKKTTIGCLLQSEGTKRFEKIMDLHNGAAGDILFNQVYGYSFYIVNTNENGASFSLRLALTMNNDDGLSDAIRIMTYYEANGYQYFTVYQKTDTESKAYNEYQEIEQRNALKEFKPGQSEIFNDERVTITGVSGSNYLRYTILFWIEGEDPDCTEKILGKSAKFELMVSIDTI